jgi:hypothetical protein
MPESATPMTFSLPPTIVITTSVCVISGALLAFSDDTTKPAAPERLGASAMRDSGDAPTMPGSPEKQGERLREGTRLIDASGSFQGVGDRIVFSPKGSKESYRILENLALQRISQTLEDVRGQRQCLVSGTITEFRGANYLLVTKYLLVNKAPSSGPEAETGTGF